MGSPSIFQSLAGRAAQVDRCLHSLLYSGYIPELDDLSKETVARYFGSYIDL